MLRADKTPYSRLAQAATEYAKSHGLADQFHRAAYKSFWADGTDLGDLMVLERLSRKVGLDWDDLGPRLAAGEYDRKMEDQHDAGLQTGIWGVPGFLVDDSFYFTGAQTLEFFRLAVKRVLSERKNGPGEGFGGRLVAGK
jgi:predicted DsbA family dithiol-disulfide isomerase